MAAHPIPQFGARLLALFWVTAFGFGALVIWRREAMESDRGWLAGGDTQPPLHGDGWHQSPRRYGRDTVPPTQQAPRGQPADSARLSQAWKAQALAKINSLGAADRRDGGASAAPHIPTAGSPPRLLLKSELDLTPLQQPASGKYEPAMLPVHNCGYNNEPLQPWMNPGDWNSSRSQRGTDLLHPDKHTPILVMGCGHSGTTYLISCIGRHPSVHLNFHHELNKVWW